MAGRDPAAGVIIQIPPHKGPATLTFDLHNLQIYSEEQVKAHRAYARYTATIGVLTLDNTLISRAVVQSEFRTATDLVDRVGGGAGPGRREGGGADRHRVDHDRRFLKAKLRSACSARSSPSSGSMARRPTRSPAGRSPSISNVSSNIARPPPKPAKAPATKIAPQETRKGRRLPAGPQSDDLKSEI